MIVTPSVDPLGEEPGYRYEWLVDEEPSGITDATVPAERTAKGEQWTVLVTPFVGDRVGAAGEASVTILNTRPTVASVGASTYRPRTDDAVRVFPTPASDVDGDTTRYLYTWFRNDEVIAGAASDTLALSDFAAGDALSIEVRANDGEEDGPATRLGPLVVDPGTTGWVPLLPNRRIDWEGFSFHAYDARAQRVLWGSGTELWELALEGSEGRWVRLWPSGTAPELFGASAIVDEARNRILLVGGYDDPTDTPNETVYVLDLTRGQEAWSRLTVGGGSPGPMLSPSLMVDPERDRLLTWGSLPFEGDFVIPARAELWSMDLTLGAETWSRVDVGGSEPGFNVGASWLVDAENDRAWLVGGVAWDAEAGVPSGGGDVVWQLDLTSGEERFSELTERLPLALIFPAAVFDPVRRRGVVFHGGRTASLESAYDGVLTFDPGAETWTEAVPESSFPAGFFGLAAWDPTAERVLAIGGTLRGARTMAIAELTTDLSWRPIDVPWVTGPGAVSKPQVVQTRDDFRIIGGRDFGGRARSEAFSYAFNTGRFSADAMISNDARHGPRPATWGAGMPSESVSALSFFFGGWSDTTSHDPPQVWELQSVTTLHLRWTLFSPATSSPVPPPRSGAVIAAETCGDTTLVALGGFDEQTSTVLGDAWQLHDCNSSRDECTWTELTGTPLPPPLADAAYAQTPSHDLVVFGGLTGTRESSDQLWVGSDCITTGGLSAVATGSGPPARHGATLTVTEPAFGTVVLYLFGGGTDALSELSDVWRLEPDPWRWTELAIPSDARHPSPAPRRFHAAAWDRARRRLLIFGGGATNPRNDLWELRIVD